MFPKQNRVSRKEITSIFNESISQSTPFFVARLKSNERPHYTFICSKQIGKTATKRNLIRRKWYGSLKEVIKKISPKNKTYVFILKQPALNTTPHERIEVLTHFLKELK